jgi:peptide/nickel transport system permease protein
VNNYLLKRLALSALTLWLVTVVVFALVRVLPGDAIVAASAQSPGEGSLTRAEIEAGRAALGLDRGIVIQYGAWFGDLISLNAGDSFVTGGSVWTEMRPRLSVTLELTLVALLIVTLGGTTLGILSASSEGSRFDTAVRSLSLLAASVPQFWIALFLVVIMASWWGYFIPVEYSHFWDDPARNTQQILIPAVILALRPLALLTRVMRASAAEVLRTDYIRAARARGLPTRNVLFRHVLSNALIPSLTVVAAQAVFLLGGAVVIESVFNLPGVGRALVQAISFRDYPIIQFLTLLIALGAAFINLGVDILYWAIDPRIKQIPTVRGS